MTIRTLQLQSKSSIEVLKAPILSYRAQQLRTGESAKGQSKSKKKSQLGKSASVMDHLSPRHSANDSGGFESRSRRTVAAPDMSNSASLSSLASQRRGISLERQTSCLTEGRYSQKDRGFFQLTSSDAKKAEKKKKCASESDLLNAGMKVGESRTGYIAPHFSGQPDGDFPAPPKPEDLLLMSASETLETVTGTEGTEGFYRSFDDIDDIDLGVLASSNPLEAAVVLRGQAEAHKARLSFNSSDSGRMSDTYGETSNSSVASSGHSNRICSNTSNCSGTAFLQAFIGN